MNHEYSSYTVVSIGVSIGSHVTSIRLCFTWLGHMLYYHHVTKIYPHKTSRCDYIISRSAKAVAWSLAAEQEY